MLCHFLPLAAAEAFTQQLMERFAVESNQSHGKDADKFLFKLAAFPPTLSHR